MLSDIRFEHLLSHFEWHDFYGYEWPPFLNRPKMCDTYGNKLDHWHSHLEPETKWIH